MNVSSPRRVPSEGRRPDPVVEARKVSTAVNFFRDVATDMNGHPPTDDQVSRGAAALARGMPPFWDWRTRSYL